MRNSFTMMEGSKLDAVRACIDGGVSKQEDSKVRHKFGSAYVIHASERIEEAAAKMEWNTIVEVVNVLPDDATITQAETTAAVDAVTAICCLVRTGQIIFDLDVMLIEEWDKNTTRTKNRMKENTEERNEKENLTTKTMFLQQTVQGPNGQLSLHRSSRVRIVVLRVHREETNPCGESPRRKQ